MKPNPTSTQADVEAGFNTFTDPPVALAAERKRTDFPVRELTHYFNGGKERTKRQEEIMAKFEEDPIFRNFDFYDLDYDQIRKRAFEQVARLSTYLIEFGVETGSVRRELSPFGLVHPSAQTRASVHYSLFVGAIRGQGTDKQYEYWKGRGMITLKRFYGCFAMTELGHGSNVAGLETTAVFDKDHDEFVINTPTTAATKWWIGGAAHSANHCVCYARLIVGGKDYGVRNFVVPLRDTAQHNVLPGISLGDIGKKMGRDGIDNGWIQFTDVRIPRTNMLMRHSQVERDGKVIVPPLAQLTYGALISGRVAMAFDSWIWARRFLLIATRYAAVRRQFSSVPGQPETRILDYVYHQRRLMPLLAQAIAIEASSSELYDLYDHVESLQRGLDPSDKKAVTEAVGSIKELFAVSAGLKAFSTWAAADTIDECRQACGGLGYSGYNGFGQGFDDWVVNCTWEGDNNVLCLSAGRALIQSGLQVLQGKHVKGVGEYLNHREKHRSTKLAVVPEIDLNEYVGAWQSVASQAIFETVALYQGLVKKGHSPAQAFEALSSERFTIARLHTRAFQLRAFCDRIRKADKSIQGVLTTICQLFCLWATEKEAASFLRYEAISGKDLEILTDQVSQLCKRVRDRAVGITDAFNLSDFFVNAPIGNYDGNVYHNYFKKVNERKPTTNGKAPYYELQKEFFQRPDADDPELKDI